jgi:plasmid stabilization system protein ParE
MTKVEFHPEAEEDLANAKQWYKQRSRLAARAFATEFAGAVRQIATSPTRWTKTEGEPRRFVLSRFPFSIVYPLEPERVYVIAIAHQRRRPGYWRER